MGTGGPLGGALPRGARRPRSATRPAAPAGAAPAAGRARARRRRDGELLQLGREGLRRLGRPLLALQLLPPLLGRVLLLIDGGRRWPRPRRRGGACAPASRPGLHLDRAAASRRRRRPRRRRRRRRSPSARRSRSRRSSSADFCGPISRSSSLESSILLACAARRLARLDASGGVWRVRGRAGVPFYQWRGYSTNAARS